MVADGFLAKGQGFVFSRILSHAGGIDAVAKRGSFHVCCGYRRTAHKVGTRHVQSRTAAGGWSQQRYARRRANQAVIAFWAFRKSGTISTEALPTM